MTAQAREAQLFDRILCGVDGTPASLDAVRRALRLQVEHGSVLLLTVANFAQAAHAGMAASHAAELMQRRGAHDVVRASDRGGHRERGRLIRGGLPSEPPPEPAKSPLARRRRDALLEDSFPDS
jgi:nucleotide-binding universal stress UspA family protein